MPVFPYFVGRDNRVTGNFFVDVGRVYDNALGQYHGYTWLHFFLAV